jgi:hypothetical protein
MTRDQRGVNAWGINTMEHMPRGRKPPPAPSNADGLTYECACGGDTWCIPGYGVPPCACKYDLLGEHKHYCACVVSYPLCCRGTVVVSDTADAHHACDHCSYPPDFEYAASLPDKAHLKHVYNKCGEHCCTYCTMGQRKLSFAVIPDRLCQRQ